MKIMQAKNTDMQSILDLQYLAYTSEAELYNDFDIPPLNQTLDELIAESKTSLILTLKINDAIAGSVRATLDNTICKIGRLIVHPNHQGLGLGTKLMGEIEKRFSEAKEYEVFTGHLSEANIKLYNRLGYRQQRETKLSEKVTLVFLRKQKTL